MYSVYRIDHRYKICACVSFEQDYSTNYEITVV